MVIRSNKFPDDPACLRPFNFDSALLVFLQMKPALVA